MINNKDVSPFLRWAGGKRWLVFNNSSIFNINYKKYIEPFLGSASVFFFCNPMQSVLSDKNKDLIDVYRAIKQDWKKVISLLNYYNIKHSKDFYYTERSVDYKDLFLKAAQFIYLNRTCWNGLYRVNNAGKFNVPIGTKQTVITKGDKFELISQRLANALLIDGDFESVIDNAEEDDLIFIDPPYTVNHNKNGFLKYNEKIFSWQDQLRLSNCVKRAKERGVKIILTNANHSSIVELYEVGFSLREVSRASVLAGNAKYRGKVTELIITANINV
ncbi:MAG: DNA adenine methylase [Deferribacterales bacterium]